MRRAVAVQRLDEEGHLLRAVRVHDPAELGPAAVRVLEHPARVGDDAHGDPGHAPGAADHLRRVVRLELVEVAPVQDAAQHLAHLVRLPVVRRQQVVQLRLGARRGHGLADGKGARRARQLAHQVADLGDAGAVVRHAVVRHAGDGVVRVGAAQRLAVRALPRGALHQVGPAQAHERRPLHHQDHVRQGGQVRAPGDARPHHGGDLRHLEVAPHDGVVVEEPRRAVLPREHPALVRQVDPRRVH